MGNIKYSDAERFCGNNGERYEIFILLGEMYARITRINFSGTSRNFARTSRCVVYGKNVRTRAAWIVP